MLGFVASHLHFSNCIQNSKSTNEEIVAGLYIQHSLRSMEKQKVRLLHVTIYTKSTSRALEPTLLCAQNTSQFL